MQSLHPFRHEAVEVRRRQVGGGEDTPFQSSTAGSALTYITPSPGASPIPVTQQSQLVSSNLPIFTLCALPPEAFFPITATPTQTTAPYKNYSISIPPGPGTCTTIYSPTVTMVCATILTGIDRMYSVTQCGQDITFSSDFGYVLATPSPTLRTATDSSGTAALITPALTVQALTTYYVATWAELTSAGPPTNVDRKICATYANGTEECVVEYYVWKTSLVTIPTSTVTSINLTTTVAGPSQIIVETFVANITEILTTFSMSTTMELTWSVETETTNIATRPTASTGPTVTQTYTPNDKYVYTPSYSDHLYIRWDDHYHSAYFTSHGGYRWMKMTEFPNKEERARMRGPRKPRTLRVDIQATQPVQPAKPTYSTCLNDMQNFDKFWDAAPLGVRYDVNKPLPPLPDQKDQKTHSRRGSRCETPRTPMDKAAHWIKERVFTPMKELFHPLEATEMITPRETQTTSGQTSSHKVRVMEQESPPRSRDSYAFLAELNIKPQADTDRQSKSRPSVDRQPDTPRHSRKPSGVSQRPTMFSHKSHASESSMSNSVRAALETSVGTAKDVGHRFGIGHESGRLVFSDTAPPGMMDPCSVCGKEPKGVLYHGKCRDYNQLVDKVSPYGAAPPSDNPIIIPSPTL
ncbi:hypothetical protein D6D01_03919 [Aureobasidium pullulans]|uniref:Uncharacterized protein n=1 Tax=Aureobasidium pullulans TaxID=5580 RepID=A0A4S9LH88_AURPU|nr:hypothetical protein D6D01_03919 [Aureobasidium pullulans]